MSRYRLETELSRTFSEFSSRQSASWKFTAQGSADNSAPTPLLWSASFRPQVDDYNRARREDTSLAFELRLPWHIPTSEAVPKLTSVRLEYSLDDGRTWRIAPVEAAGTRSEPNLPGYGKPFQLYVAKVQHSRTAQYVSLRLTAEDGKGNNVKQVIIRAYGLR